MAGDLDDDAIETERYDFLMEIANDLQDADVLPRSAIVLRGARLKLATHSYFVLNDAYHRWRIEDGHYTQPPKIVALQCLCVLRMQPFLPLDFRDVHSVAEARANEIFCLAYACAVLGVDMNELSVDSKDRWLRILDILNRSNCETIELVVETANQRIIRKRNEYHLAIIDSDKAYIDALITIFELLSDNAKLRKTQNA